jgi:exopolyphosphatase/guanosine-5'-triphosphate,3'-diphosphate pyrophosphatase
VTPDPDAHPQAAAARQEFLTLMRRLEEEPAHVEHVTGLVLGLFDDLRPHHGLGAGERLLLEGAGRLHDIGHRSKEDGGHHLHSARMILAHPWKSLTHAEVVIIAQVARHHRREPPGAEHDDFTALDVPQRRVVHWLAGLLRVADGLDKSHRQLVRRVTVELAPGRATFQLDTNGPAAREIVAALKKGNLLATLLQRPLVFVPSEESKVQPAA